LLLPCRVILDRRVVIIGVRIEAESGHVDVARAIDGNSCGFVVVIVWPIVTGNSRFLYAARER